MDILIDDGADIFQVLNAIERKTGLFILNRNLDYLYHFILGYTFLARCTKANVKNIEMLEAFSLFVKKELNEEKNSACDWFGSLRFHYGTGQGFEKFFEYWSKFKEVNVY